MHKVKVTIAMALTVTIYSGIFLGIGKLADLALQFVVLLNK